MASTFKTLEKHYSTSCASAINELNQYDQTKEGSHLHSAQKYLDEIQDLVEQMEYESTSNRTDRKTALTYKKEFQSIESRWKSLREEQTRSQLFAKSSNSAYNQGSNSNNQTSSFSNNNVSNNDKQSLLDNERLERSTRKLKDGYRVALDTEAHGMDILNELQREREVLERSKNRLNHANTMLGNSSDIVTQMYRHVIQDRVLLGLGRYIIYIINREYGNVSKEIRHSCSNKFYLFTNPFLYCTRFARLLES